MVLLTTYLANLTVLRKEATIHAKYNPKIDGLLFSAEDALDQIGLKNPKVYYVMRKRGNDIVAPNKQLLWEGKSGLISWEQYKRDYLEQIQFTNEAIQWIKKVAFESIDRDVVLVCFEKDHTHCHRNLLAREIVRQHPEVNYIGELRKARV